MSNSTPTKALSLPVILQVGTRQVTVDSAPLPVRMVWGFRTAAIAQPSPGCLCIGPFWKARLLSLPFLLLAVVLGLAVVVAKPDGRVQFWSMIVGAVGFFLAGAAVLVLQPSVRFDVDIGQMTHGWVMARRTRPLADILAVQVLFGGIHDMEDATSFPTYQLNLVLDDPDEPRLNLTNHADRAWTQEAAKRIAAFLGVPLLDQLPPSDAEASH